MTKKVCVQCGELKTANNNKLLSEFVKDRRNSSGFSNRCKSCDKKYIPKRITAKNEQIKPIEHYLVELAVTSTYGITTQELKRLCRGIRYTEPRHLIWKILSEIFNLKICEISGMYQVTTTNSKANHATIIYGIKSINNLIDTEELTKARYTAALEYLQDIEA